MMRCLGIFRELTNSPSREQDDALILKAVTEELSRLGADTHLIEPENLDLIKPGEWDAVLPMCEAYQALLKIKSWENPPLLINTPQGVFNCYRTNMLPLLESCRDIFPLSEIRYTRSLPGNPPAFFDGKGAWLKRGDVHNQTLHDVLYVKNWADSVEVKKDFESREITSVVIQEHVPGDLIKFYGVGPFKWFNWFYHKPAEAANYPFSLTELEKQAGRVAKAVGLEVYGGDAIITPEGRIYVIDINSWPSFARVRSEARIHIARHVHERVLTAINKGER